MKLYSPWQFSLFRIVFGVYLSIHFFMLLPYATELFSRDGLIKNAALNPTAGLFPNPLACDFPAWFSTVFLVAMLGCSLLFTVGYRRPFVSGLLWFGCTALFHRNNLIGNPSIPYVGLLLMLCVIIPSGEPLHLGKATMKKWEMPVWVFRAAWILLALGYTFSGVTKCFSPSWIDGSAMNYLLLNPLARPGVILDLMSALPEWSLKLLTWSTLLLELMFVPFALWRKARPWAWLVMVLMHVGILLVIDFSDLSFGMLMVHAFTFDPRWIRPRAPRSGKMMVAYDGNCLMCSRSIRFLAKEDRYELILLTPLQGSVGETIRQRHGQASIDSVLVDSDGKIVEKSEAVLRILAALGGHWRIFSMIGSCLPARLLDSCYDWVAQRRHHWFKKGMLCELPSPELTARLRLEE